MMDSFTESTTPIIMVNWNGLLDTIECVKSVLSMSQKDILIVIVDNNSENDEGAKLTKIYQDCSNIEVIVNDSNKGFCGANIQAFNYLKTQSINYKWLCLLNNDTSVDKNWLENLLKFAESTESDVISSKMIQYFDRQLMDNAGHFILNTGEILPIGYGESIMKYNTPIENVGCCGGAALYRFDMINNIGFFDPYFNNGYEDAELGYRAFLSGFKCLMCPNAIVYHKGGASIGKVFNEEYAIKTQMDILYTYLKLMPRYYKVLNFPFICGRYLLMLVVLGLTGKWKHAKIVFKAILRVLKFGNNRSKLNKIEISIWKLFGTQRFFLWFDVKRFFKSIVLRQTNSLDRY